MWPGEYAFFKSFLPSYRVLKQLLSGIALVKELMENTRTQTGLKVFVHLIDKVYQTGRKVLADFKENMRLVFDEVLPQWNYRAIPLAQARGKVV
mgnify:CR=1 FL=1